ncbi:NmrA-like protein [Macrophomina phaseolina MS6]|uniref:NmrA-like protein n=1 Tax=Macrophomina phaseolina (strain MS6) TaxID=1126212 RepID=K2RJK1_MACPH|nr:NmrA-like protein [Macrophomina phaseolina MS6]
MAYETIALFGANGQIGQRILERLSHNPKANFKVLAFIPPQDELPSAGNDHKTVIKTFDANDFSREELAKDLKGVDAVVSALNGKALNAQTIIQDAAADAGVKRFYPSEYGMHHIYRKPDDSRGYLHPLWNQKDELNEKAVLHPAVLSGKMSYTVIGCGDFYNQDREPVWCPWTRDDVSEYTIHVIGDPEMRADFTHLDDFAEYLVATLLEPEKSENQYLNFVSDTISHMEIADKLRKVTGKTVKLECFPLEKMHEIATEPQKAPAELKQSAFPPDFWFMVKGMQGQGRFRRPRGQIHNDVFPDVERTTFEKYFTQKFKPE